MKVLTPIPKQFVDASGVPYSNGTVSVYHAGTTEFAEIYADAAAESLAQNPFVLDSHGSWVCFVSPGVPLDYVVQSNTGNVVFKFADVAAEGGGSGGVTKAYVDSQDNAIRTTVSEVATSVVTEHNRATAAEAAAKTVVTEGVGIQVTPTENPVDHHLSFEVKNTGVLGVDIISPQDTLIVSKQLTQKGSLKFELDVRNPASRVNLFVALYNETRFSEIADAVIAGKVVIMATGTTGLFIPMCVWSSGGCVFRSTVDAYGFYRLYTVAMNDQWTVETVGIGEDVPTESSMKLLTSGGAYTALAGKADAANITPGYYVKPQVNSQGIVTGGGQLDPSDIPNGAIPPEGLESIRHLFVDGVTILAEETQNQVLLKAGNTFYAVYGTTTLAEIQEAYDRHAVVFTLIPRSMSTPVMAMLASIESGRAVFRSTVTVSGVATTYFAVLLGPDSWSNATETAYFGVALQLLEEVTDTIPGDPSILQYTLEEGKFYTLSFTGSREVELRTDSTKPIHVLLYVRCGADVSSCITGTLSWYAESGLLHSASFYFQQTDDSNEYALDITIQKVVASEDPLTEISIARVRDLPVLFRKVALGNADLNADVDNTNIGRKHSPGVG